MGIWGLCPQRGPGAEPLVRVQGAKPPEAENILAYIKTNGERKFGSCEVFLLGYYSVVTSLTEEEV